MITETSHWTDADSARAREIWAEYERQHELSAMRGQTAGIDPHTGRIWFGESIGEIVEQLDAEGIHALLYFVRIGYEYYERKGGHR